MIAWRASVVLLCTLLALSRPLAAPARVYAADPQPVATATPDGNPAPDPTGGFSFPDPKRWATDVFSQVLVNLFRTITLALRTLVASVLSSSLNFITQTPPAGSYASPTVRTLWGVVRGIANAGLALAALWGGFNIIVRQHTGATYHDTMELLPRLVLGALLVNTSLWWGQLAIDANNALCQAIGQPDLPAWDRVDTTNQLLIVVITTLVYLVVGLLLLLQQLMRLALVDMLLVIAPLGLLCWVLPQTQAWARRWSANFFNTVFLQFLQVVTLKIGGSLLNDLAPQSPDAVVLSLFLGVAVLVLTLKLPAFMHTHLGDSSSFVRPPSLRPATRAASGGNAVASNAKGGR